MTAWSQPGSGGMPVSVELIWAKIARRKAFIAVLSLLLFGMGAAVLVLLPPWYTTEAEVVVEQRPQGVDLASVLSRIPTDSQAVLTEAEALRSRALVQRTIRELDLLSHPEFNARIIPADGSLRARWRQGKAAVVNFVTSLIPGPRRPVVGDPVLNDASEIFLKHLRVAPIGRSQVLKVSFTSESPGLASEILNKLVTLYLAAQMENRVAVPTKMREFLKGQLDSMQARVRESNDAVERYRSQAQLQQGFDQGREALLRTHELSEANKELMAVRIKRQEAEARLNEIRANPSTSPEVIANVTLQNLRNELSGLKQNKAQLVARYGTSYPRLREVEASIDDGEQRLATELGKIARSLASDVAIQTAREAQLTRTVADLKDQIQDTAGDRVKLASLEQEAEVNRSTLGTFLVQYNQLTSQRTLQIADSYVLTGADIPTTPTFPPLLPFLAFILFLSVAVSTGCAILLERSGDTIRSVHEVQPLLASRSLGLVPRHGGGGSLAVEVIDRPQSLYTEAIRGILSRLTPARDAGRSVLVASARAGEGRTTVATSLARLAALSGRRVVLVDGNLRHPSVHDVLDAPLAQGLTELLQGRIDVSRAIRRDRLTSLDFISAGALGPHAADLLGLPGMDRLMTRLRGEYDLVIVDSPPSGSVSDARVLARLADEFLFVVGWNSTEWRLVREQLAELSFHNRDLVGVVLNRVDLRRHARYRQGHIGPEQASAMIGTAG